MVITLKNILIICLITYLCLISNQQAFAQFNDGGVFNKGTLVSETDGDPTVKAKEIKFPVDMVTDNADGTVTINNNMCPTGLTTGTFCIVYDTSDSLLKIYVNGTLQAHFPDVATYAYMLLETDDFILLEDGGKIRLE